MVVFVDHCVVDGFEGCIGAMAEKALAREFPIPALSGVCVGLRAAKVFNDGFELGWAKLEVCGCFRLTPLVLLWLVLDVAELDQSKTGVVVRED